MFDQSPSPVSRILVTRDKTLGIQVFHATCADIAAYNLSNGLAIRAMASYLSIPHVVVRP